MLAPVALGDVRDGLIAYWPLDEGSGDEWKDAVGNHDAEVEEQGKGGWSDDAKYGKGYSFWETLVRVANADDINELPEGFTIAHQIYPDYGSGLGGGGAIMDKSASNAARIEWYILGDHRHHWGLRGAVGFSDDSPVPKFREWYHFAWSHTPPESAIYRDGKEVARSPNLGDVPITDADMYFGNRLPNEGRGEWLKGILDDIGFWNRGLKPDEVAEVATRGLAFLLAVSPQGKMATTWARIKNR